MAPRLHGDSEQQFSASELAAMSPRLARAVLNKKRGVSETVSPDVSLTKNRIFSPLQNLSEDTRNAAFKSSRNTL
jgi:hypothetical protein